MDTKFQIKFPSLNDKEWLIEKYSNKKLSLSKIANEIGCTINGVRSALIRNQIKLRSRGEGIRLKKENYFIINDDVINGCLLGDAHLRIQNPDSKDSFPSFHHTSKNYDYSLLIASQLFIQNYKQMVKERNNGKNNIFRLSSFASEDLIQVYQKWYPISNNRKKIIPENIIITNKLLLYWFLDDGYSYYVNNKKMNRNSIRIEFACQSFQKLELQNLCNKIKQEFGLIMSVRFHQRNKQIKGTGYTIALSEKKEQVELFYSIIGKCPVQSFQYKWKTFTFKKG